MKKEKSNFVKRFAKLLKSHSVDIETALNEQDPEAALKAIEKLIEDLEQVHFAISLAINPPDYETCTETACPSHPSKAN